MELQAIEHRMHALRRKIAAFDYVASGTLLTRRMRCGNPTCRCQKKKTWRHGPYHNWTRMQKKRLVHRYLNDEQEKLIRKAIRNYRTIQKILRQWEQETIKSINMKKFQKTEF